MNPYTPPESFPESGSPQEEKPAGPLEYRNLVTVGRFNLPIDAQMFRMSLESAGIDAVLQDENTIQVDMLLSNAIGGVRVQVAEEDVAAAQEIWAVNEARRADRATSPVTCPNCQSQKAISLPPEWSIWRILTLGMASSSKKWKCEDCGGEYYQ
jgi:hypothetical protein